jgi:hypothetical protein
LQPFTDLDRGARAGAGSHGALAAEHQGALADAGEAEAALPLLEVREMRGVEAPTIVADREDERVAFLPHAHLDLARTRVPGDVGQPLLEDAVERRLRRGLEASRRRGIAKQRHLHCVGPLEVLAEPLHGGGEPQLLQDDRPEPTRQPPHLAVRHGRELAELARPRARGLEVSRVFDRAG